MVGNVNVNINEIYGLLISAIFTYTIPACFAVIMFFISVNKWFEKYQKAKEEHNKAILAQNREFIESIVKIENIKIWRVINEIKGDAIKDKQFFTDAIAKFFQ